MMNEKLINICKELLEIEIQMQALKKKSEALMEPLTWDELDELETLLIDYKKERIK